MTENERLPPGGPGTCVVPLCPAPAPSRQPRETLGLAVGGRQGWAGVRPLPVNSCLCSAEGGHFGSELRHCRLRGTALENRPPHCFCTFAHSSFQSLLGRGNCSVALWILPEGVPVSASEPHAQREALAFTVSTVPVAPAAHLGPHGPVPLDGGPGAGGLESCFLPSHPGFWAPRQQQAGHALGPT